MILYKIQLPELAELDKKITHTSRTGQNNHSYASRTRSRCILDKVPMHTGQGPDAYWTRFLDTPWMHNWMHMDTTCFCVRSNLITCLDVQTWSCWVLGSYFYDLGGLFVFFTPLGGYF